VSYIGSAFIRTSSDRSIASLSTLTPRYSRFTTVETYSSRCNMELCARVEFKGGGGLRRS